MLLLMLYPLRKRLPPVHWSGSIGLWFRLHMLLGLLGPLIDPLSCALHLCRRPTAGSRLLAMLVVVASGLTGRFIYGHVHRGFSQRKIETRELLEELAQSRLLLDADGNTGHHVVQRLERLERAALVKRLTLFGNAASMLSIEVRSRILYWQLLRTIRSEEVTEASALKLSDRDDHASPARDPAPPRAISARDPRAGRVRFLRPAASRLALSALAAVPVPAGDGDAAYRGSAYVLMSRRALIVALVALLARGGRRSPCCGRRSSGWSAPGRCRAPMPSSRRAARPATSPSRPLAERPKCMACHQGVARDVRERDRLPRPHRRGAPRPVPHLPHRASRDGAGSGRPAPGQVRSPEEQFPDRRQASRAAMPQLPRARRAVPRRAARLRRLPRARTTPIRDASAATAPAATVDAGWKVIRAFDHKVTGFPLVGAHQKTQCAACHVGGRFAGTPRQCVACHLKDDIHKGANGRDCATCHSPVSWKGARFDHDRTRFPLVGRHKAVTCASCHGARKERPRPPMTCVACHRKDDVHRGANGPNCATCHSPLSWKAVTFDHDRGTRFPLRGAHRRVPCAACHIRPVASFKPPMTCVGCHQSKDVHRGALGRNCASCHSNDKWRPAATLQPCAHQLPADRRACPRHLRQLPPRQELPRRRHDLRQLPRRHRPQGTLRIAGQMRVVPQHGQLDSGDVRP